jgi:hypothetical protein
VLVSLLVAAAVASAPSPAPSPQVLQEIGRVRAVSPFCSTLRDNVAPALVALMKADDVIVGGQTRLTTMGRHQVLKQGAYLEFDRIALGQTVARLVQHLRVVDAMLADKQRFPETVQTEDDRDALAMKAQLQAVANEQKTTLNVINGTLETDLLGLLQKRPADSNVDATSGEPLSGLDSAGLSSTTAPGATDLRSTAASGLFGRTLYDTMAYAVAVQRAEIDRRERFASTTVIANARRCNP